IEDEGGIIKGKAHCVTPGANEIIIPFNLESKPIRLSIKPSIAQNNVIEIKRIKLKYKKNYTEWIGEEVVRSFHLSLFQPSDLLTNKLITRNSRFATSQLTIENFEFEESKKKFPDSAPQGWDISSLDVGAETEAVLRIEGEGYDFVELGDSEDIIIGEWVIALGNPFGLIEINSKPTVTVGVVSARDRDFGKQKSNRVYQDMIQTDAAINQGNSGGPLVNSLGEVIGMNTFIYTGSDYNTGSIGLGFALPSNHISRVIKDLKEYGEVNRRFRTGLEVDDISPIVARYFRLRSTDGVIVTDVEKNSSAARAGLEVRDIILEVNGKKIGDESDIWSVIENSDLRGGDKLNFKVLRGERILNISMKLESVN
ncbi:trypsin-like peptidase domain-containing protein, partial [candidate division KSB1 bacterium]|nr:trypsin-like peptidase domain-containing protein [candidate division KSB1 bacterium]